MEKSIVNGYHELAMSCGCVYKCTGNELYKISVRDEKNYAHLIPYITNSAFACELFLKSMIPNDNQNKSKRKNRQDTKRKNNKTHGLCELFLSLDSNRQREIKDKTIEKIAISFDSSYSDKDFDSDFKMHSNSFVDWRYFFERTTNDEELKAKPQFMLCFMEALYEIAKEHYLTEDKTT